MPTFGAYLNGATMGVGNPAPTGGARGRITGWSPAAVRRHKRWLYSVDALELSGTGDAVTLTLRACPPSSVEWMALVRKLFRFLREDEMLRWHWVVEWQRRCVPHLHLALYGREGDLPGIKAMSAWLDIAGEYGPVLSGQHVTPITGPVGWLKYLSKHASRGVQHYQRQGKPAGWETTGRLWGYGGEWPLVEPVRGILTMPQMWRVRRMVRRYAIAEARSRGDWRGVRYLRGMLQSNDRALCTVRGVSEWVPGPVFVAMALCAGWSGEVAE